MASLAFEGQCIFFDFPVKGAQPDIEKPCGFCLIAPGVDEHRLDMEFLDAGQVKVRDRTGHPHACGPQFRRQVVSCQSARNFSSSSIIRTVPEAISLQFAAKTLGFPPNSLLLLPLGPEGARHGWLIPTFNQERWQSGRLWQSRKLLYGKLYRGFESLPLRQSNECPGFAGHFCL